MRLACTLVTCVLLSAFPGVVSAATFVVNSTDDDSDNNAGNGQCWTGGIVVVGMFGVNECTLRAALEEASALPGADVIGFSSLLPQTLGFTTITPASALPTSFDTVEIDGTTAAGYDTASPGAAPVIQIDGGAVAGTGLSFGGVVSGSGVRGLALFGFGGIAINMGQSDSVIEGCHIGLERNFIVTGNGGHGIVVIGSRSVVGQSCGPGVGCSGRRNVVVASGGDGVRISGEDIVVAGNRIGTNPAGTATSILATSTANEGVGVVASSSARDAVIGALGSVPAPPGPDTPVASGNVISGNDGGGLRIEAVQVSVFANRIGTDVSGTVSLGGQSRGIQVESDAATIGALGVGGNVIGGNTHGIVIGDTVDASLNVVEGNWIGVDATGTTAVGNAQLGVDVRRGVFNVVSGNLIGANATGVRVIAQETMVVDNFVGSNAAGVDLGNSSAGIRVAGDETSIAGNTVGFTAGVGITLETFVENARVFSNFVGTDAEGRDLGNTNAGVLVGAFATGVIGGDVSTPAGSLPLLANEIAFNGQGGAALSNTSLAAIRGNSFHDNTNLGIDLDFDGPTPNDAGDGDDGANGLQNHPVLDPAQTFYVPQTDQLSVRYRVDSTPGSNAVYPLAIDFYLEDGAGEGETWVGSDVYQAGEASAYVVASFPVPGGVTIGDAKLLATATDSSGAGRTSEFGAIVAVPEPHPLLGRHRRTAGARSQAAVGVRGPVRC